MRKEFMQWQLYAHYIIDTILIFLYYFFINKPKETSTPLFMFFEFLILLFVVDTITHTFFYYAKKPIRWRG